MRWRARLVTLHRDLGYLAFGLTFAYAVSGIAVNHRHHWNYNQSAERSETRVGTPAQLLASLPQARRDELARDPASLTKDEEPALVAALGTALGRSAPPKNAFWRGRDRFSLFFETGDRDTVDYDPATGLARHLALADRPLIRDVNFLHLNERHGAWTWFADGYALALLFLALSGAIMIRGPKQLVSRKGVFLALGIVVPVLALVWMRYL
ncbi:MAG TPA: PepSY-associated TM helix domain-containing protein [Myxococcales bacterium]